MTTKREKLADSKQRCAWAQYEDLMSKYHDEEWGVPQHDSRMLWEMLMLEGFQAGLSWAIILRKREGFRRAFKNFDPKKVAKFTALDVEDLMQNEGIVRARAKIEATILGAKIYLDLQKNGEDLATWLWAVVDNKPIQNSGPIPVQTDLSVRVSKELKKRGFKFCGPTIVYAWLQAVGIVNDHAPDCFRRKAVTRLQCPVSKVHGKTLSSFA
ncbi:DNA-3-methyladenine glycosylase I [Granulicella paludicola]|uniref:DNA-3-methyladenine glycosylase I n=1 Tax=Granulicella paludicola TaxID=474951 RepID=UPI0021DF660A|nr:DNA-3-methyladenine glycosylase I [Granulicella paludicola]